jgi:hypothetical protein
VRVEYAYSLSTNQRGSTSAALAKEDPRCPHGVSWSAPINPYTNYFAQTPPVDAGPQSLLPGKLGVVSFFSAKTRLKRLTSMGSVDTRDFLLAVFSTSGFSGSRSSRQRKVVPDTLRSCASTTMFWQPLIRSTATCRKCSAYPTHSFFRQGVSYITVSFSGFTPFRFATSRSTFQFAS